MKTPYWLHAVVTWGVFGLGGITGSFGLNCHVLAVTNWLKKKFLVKMDSGEIKYIKFQKIVPRRKYSSKLKLQLKLKEINLSKKKKLDAFQFNFSRIVNYIFY